MWRKKWKSSLYCIVKWWDFGDILWSSKRSNVVVCVTEGSPQHKFQRTSSQGLSPPCHLLNMLIQYCLMTFLSMLQARVVTGQAGERMASSGGPDFSLPRKCWECVSQPAVASTLAWFQSTSWTWVLQVLMICPYYEMLLGPLKPVTPPLQRHFQG